MSIRIVVADHHALLRSCLKTLLEKQPGLADVIEVDGGRRAVEFMAHPGAAGLPDVLILDLDMHDLGGLAATRQIMLVQPQARILMLSWHDDLPLVSAALAAGARGYMLKDDPLPALVQAIRHVVAGRIHVSSSLQSQTSGDSMSAFC